MFFIPQYIFILFTTITIDYVAAIWIEKSDNNHKKLYLIISIISTCMVLFIFKYFDFFNQNMLYLSEIIGFDYPEKTIKLILPIGLSFHTFQSLSYVIEVYKSRYKAEKHFGIYSLYVMFYPQLVTGPIERPQNLLAQLREQKKFVYSNISEGLRLILFGLFIKMVIADNIATCVDIIYKNPSTYSSFSIFKGLFLYSFQVYCDFLGYSTIAIGCAKSMGYTLMDNFKNPYFSKNIAEFWQRWHISLSTWFRDYVYFSLGGNKVKVHRWILNILIVFVISGLWHGANWTFILFGFSHGILYIIETLFNRHIKIKISNNTVSLFIKTFKVIKTFIIVSFIFVLFRASNILQIKIIFESIINNFKIVDNFHIEPKIWLLLSLFIIIDILLFNTRFDYWCNKMNWVLRWTLYSLMIFLIVVFSSVNNFPFIYFRF